MSIESKKEKRDGAKDESGRNRISGQKYSIILTDKEIEQLNKMFSFENTIQAKIRRSIEYSYNNSSFGTINLLNIKCSEDPNITLHFILKSSKNFEDKDSEKNLFVCNKILFNPLTEGFDIEINCDDIVNDGETKLVDVDKTSHEILKETRSRYDNDKLIGFNKGHDISKYNRYNRTIVKEIEDLNKEKDMLMSEIDHFNRSNKFRTYESWIDDNFTDTTLNLLKEQKVDFNSMIDILSKEYLESPQKQNEKILTSFYRIIEKYDPNLLSKNYNFPSVDSDFKNFISNYNLEKFQKSLNNEFECASSEIKGKTSNIIKFPEIHLIIILSLIKELIKFNRLKKNYACLAPIKEEFDKGYNDFVGTVKNKLSGINNINTKLKKYRSNTLSLKIKSTDYTTINS